jgi:uncharacterized glyoxalase superfamily protein PhnB
VAGALRVGLRVEDVTAAVEFYRGLGFEQVGAVPDQGGETVLAILQSGEANLVVDALVGLPFPESDRERATQSGPRGLGVVIGLEVNDLEAAYAYCTASGCAITCEPMDEAWGERLFAFVDPSGYEWKLSIPIANGSTIDGTEAARRSWFGAAD